MDPPPNANGTSVYIGCALTIKMRSELSPRRSSGQGQTKGMEKSTTIPFCCKGGDPHQPTNGTLLPTNDAVYTCTEFFLGGPMGPLRRCRVWQRKPTGGRALQRVTTAVSPSVLALTSEQGREIDSRLKAYALPWCFPFRAFVLGGGLGEPRHLDAMRPRDLTTPLTFVACGFGFHLSSVASGFVGLLGEGGGGCTTKLFHFTAAVHAQHRQYQFHSSINVTSVAV